MKIAAIQNNITFGKKLKAKAAVCKKNKTYPCKIYELEKQDKDYFKNLEDDANWQTAHYVHRLDTIMQKDNIGKMTNVYVLEDKKHNCLGYIQTFNNYDINTVNIDYIETMPKYQGTTKGKEIKYIGETLLAFMANKIRNDNNYPQLTIETPLKAAMNFYTKKCFFRKSKQYDTGPIWMSSYYSYKLIEQNEKHTMKKMKLYKL